MGVEFEIHDYIGLGITLIVAIMGIYWFYRMKSARKSLNDLVDVYESMNIICQTTVADRVTILKTSNGGGRLHPARPVYLQILHEEWRPPSYAIRQRYQKIPLDLEYVRMLQKLLLDKKVAIDVSTMPECFLRRAYVTMKVKHSLIFYLKHNEESIYYMSISTCDDRRMNTASDMDTFDIYVQKIKSVFKNI